jgi:hypothetical protein
MAMRQEDFENLKHVEDMYRGINHSQHEDLRDAAQEMQNPPHCANCDIDILWPPTVVQGITYCCVGCAAGGPCCCDYSQYRSVTISGIIHYGPDEDALQKAPNQETS